MTQNPWPEKWPSVDTSQNPQKATSEGFAGDPPRAILDESTSMNLPMPVVPAETTASKQRGRPFQPGESGNPSGRPRGGRNRLSEVLLSIVVEDFVAHGAEAMAQLRKKDPATYLRLVASLVPREMILQREEAPAVDYAELSDAEVVRLLEEQQRRKFIENALNSVQPYLSSLAR
jgi:Family of unknown function (DUF5681)